MSLGGWQLRALRIHLPLTPEWYEHHAEYVIGDGRDGLQIMSRRKWEKMTNPTPSGGIGRYAKFLVAALLAAAYALQAALSDGTVTNTEWLGIGVAVLSALGVLVVPNAKRSDQ